DEYGRHVGNALIPRTAALPRPVFSITCASVLADRSSPIAARRRIDTNGSASMTIAYPITPMAGRSRTGRPAYQTNAAEISSATPSAHAVGGIAARSAGVGLI